MVFENYCIQSLEKCGSFAMLMACRFHLHSKWNAFSYVGYLCKLCMQKYSKSTLTDPGQGFWAEAQLHRMPLITILSEQVTHFPVRSVGMRLYHNKNYSCSRSLQDQHWGKANHGPTPHTSLQYSDTGTIIASPISTERSIFSMFQQACQQRLPKRLDEHFHLSLKKILTWHL